MVCKRSLYCWKNGPCASDQARKQIWEENIRFRESLKNLNRSDHYWSFQISNLCLCSEGEGSYYYKSPSKKYHSRSLQKLNDVDCASVTHGCNGLKFKNCHIHYPNHETKTLEVKRADTPLPQPLFKENNNLTSCHEKQSKKVRQPGQLLYKTNENKSEFCPRYINTLSNSNLNPSMKMKFSSQSNLESCGKSNTLQKKRIHGSCQDILMSVQNNDSLIGKVGNETKREDKGVCTSDLHVEKQEITKLKKELSQRVKFNRPESLKDYAPMSRTTRKMVNGNKKIPFLTYGCNNSNLDIGSKRTHNVLASKLEVFPNALTAKQQKTDLILKYMQREKDFQRKCLPENLKKGFVNHSSLWCLDQGGKNKPLQQGITKCIPPSVRQPKKLSPLLTKDTIPFKTYRKPEIRFY